MNPLTDTQVTIAALRNVVKRYGAIVAVDHVELDIRRGEVLALLGPNGAGKSTSINLLLGLAWPTSGGVELFGRSPREVNTRRRIGAMLQGAQLRGHARVQEVVALQSGYYPNPLSLADTLHTAGLEGLEHLPVARLSGGQKQRLLFALAICGNSELLFLDEPTVGLDVEARRGLWTSIRKLREQGRSVVLTTHYIEEADALADRIVVINHGRMIAQGTPAEIKRTVAQRHIRCITKLDAAKIRTLGGVTRITADGGRLDIVAERPENVLFEILKLDPELHDLEVTGARLEDAFLALTQDNPGEQAA